MGAPLIPFSADHEGTWSRTSRTGDSEPRISDRPLAEPRGPTGTRHVRAGSRSFRFSVWWSISGEGQRQRTGANALAAAGPTLVTCTTVPVTTDLRCSSWTRAHGVDPVGSAGCYAGFLLVESPPPWPRDIGEIPALHTIAAAAKEAGYRLQALLPTNPSGTARVIHYRWDPNQGRFVGLEASGGDDPSAIALSLLAGSTPSQSRELAETTDLLICGHGGRDRCCGSLGTVLELEMKRRSLRDVRVWRTSHTGGHRFAPTGIVFPSGTSWGYLDADALTSIVTRSTPASGYTSRYRGCIGLATRGAQAVERAVLAMAGWQVLDWPRRSEEIADGVVELIATTPHGERRWRGKVEVVRTLPVPDCGSRLSGEEKTEDELAVIDLEEQPKIEEAVSQ